MKIILVGLNYKEHASELNMDIPEEPVLFLKPDSAVTKNGHPIVLPAGVGRVDYEGEIAVIISKRCKDLRREDVLSVISGVIALNDVTARDLQKKDGQWTRAKGFDSFCPIAEKRITITKEEDFSRLRLRTFLNGQLVQDSSSEDMIFDIPYLISFVSHIMTLYPGDIISTGTPPGIGVLSRGDMISVSVNLDSQATIVENPVV